MDIEKQLRKIEYKKLVPDEKLVSDTKRILRKESERIRKTGRKGGMLTGFAIGIPVLATLLVAMILVFNPRVNPGKVSADSSFYTIDINPSIVLEVDENDLIVGITCRNDEAIILMNGLPCLGLDIREAIPLIVTKARELGYIADDTEDYVLIARFGDDGESMSEEEVNRIVSDATGGQANVLFLIGSLKDKEEAEKAGKSAGIYLLEKHAKEQGIMDKEYKSDVESIQADVEAINLPASVISAAIVEGRLVLEWERVVHNEFSGYKVVASETNPEPSYPEDGYIAYIQDKETTRLEVDASLSALLKEGREYYFSITVLYKGGFTEKGNAVRAMVPVVAAEEPPSATNIPSPAPTPSPAITPAPTSTPEPTPSPSPSSEPTPAVTKAASGITGIAGEDGIVLEWERIDDDGFLGYKVVASGTNPNPSYPDDGYLKYITNRDSTTVFLPYSGFAESGDYWFGITVLYSDGSKISGNSVKLTIPEVLPNPEPDIHGSSTIAGEPSGDVVHLTWSKISSGDFSGYKVVASMTNPEPSYPADGYIAYITNPSTTELYVHEGFSGLKGGQSYWFSITALYDDGTRVPGNAVKLLIPDINYDSEEKPVPLVEAAINDGMIVIEWSISPNDSIQGFKVVASNSNPSPQYPGDGYLAYIEAGGPLVYSTPVSGFITGETYWFSVTTLFEDGTKTVGNAVEIQMPEGSTLPATMVTGSVEEDGIHLEWDVIDHALFQGYKVVKSKSNPNPVYPADGYVYYITDRNTNSCVIPFTELESGRTYYFSITTLYTTGERIPGNSIALQVP